MAGEAGSDPKNVMKKPELSLFSYLQKPYRLLWPSQPQEAEVTSLQHRVDALCSLSYAAFCNETRGEAIGCMIQKRKHHQKAVGMLTAARCPSKLRSVDSMMGKRNEGAEVRLTSTTDSLKVFTLFSSKYCTLNKLLLLPLLRT
jgi:hypothetical protein